MPNTTLRFIAYITLFSLILPQYDVVNAKPFSGIESQPLKVMTDETITITNNSEAINGDVTSPAALKKNPGNDGVSLPEAILAAESCNEYVAIKFDPSLIDSTIAVTGSLPPILNGNLSIDGNIDMDSNPDITIDGTNAEGFNGFDIIGASNVVIKGLKIHGFKKHGINITTNKENGNDIVENLVIHQNTISNFKDYAAISLMPYEQGNVTIRNVEISSNKIQNNQSGISIIAGMGAGASNNEISNVSIINNLIDNPNQNIGIFVSTSASHSLTNNSILNLQILENKIIHHNDSSILIAGGNDPNCNNNTIDGVLIAENYIEGSPVTIEFVTAAGMYSNGNLITNVHLRDNILFYGGIHFGGATGYSSYNNATSNVVIERNHITSSAANGIYLVAGSDGAKNNLFENLILRDNLIFGSRDAGILLHANDAFSPDNIIKNVTITNQTLVNNGIGSSWAGGININSKHPSNVITGVNISNSILWGNGFGDVIRGSVAPNSVSYSILADTRYLDSDNNIYQSPEFVDPSMMNYRLQATSPCVDSGNPTTNLLSSKDLDWNLRVWDGDSDTLAIVDRGAYEYFSVATQNIKIEGNGISIMNGDRVPVSWDGTDFGNASLFSDALHHSFTIKNNGDAPLYLINTPEVEIIGADACDYTILTQPTSPIPGGGSITFKVVFTPSKTGIRKATIRIRSNDSEKTPYSFAIQGKGLAQEFRLFLPTIIR